MKNRRLSAKLGAVHFRPSSFDQVERAVDKALAADPPIPLTLGYVNPHVITTADSEPAIVEHLIDCDHVCVDGTGVWLALRLWRNDIERLPGYRAADQLLDSGVFRGRTVLIGIEPDLIEPAVEGFSARSSLVEVVGWAHGYSSDEEISAMLSVAEPRLVLIGAGSPRSEHIALVARRVCPNAVVFHVGGGTLNNWTGRRPHAPKVLSTLGIDWMYRFVREPHTRRRYMVGIPEFVRRAVTGPRSISTVEVAAEPAPEPTLEEIADQSAEVLRNEHGARS